MDKKELRRLFKLWEAEELDAIIVLEALNKYLKGDKK